MPTVFIRTQALEPRHLIETQHSLEQKPRATAICYCYLFQACVKFTLHVNSQPSIYCT